MNAAGQQLPRRFGRYVLEKLLGRGAISNAYLAARTRPDGTEEHVVVKLIHRFLVQDPEQLDLFLSEAQVLAELDHPGIARILDVGLVDDVPYLAVEFIAGRDLTSVLKAHAPRGNIPLPVCIHLGREMAAALNHAHTRTDESGRELRIVHRDVSPNNALVRFDGGVTLIDFGIARSRLRSTKTMVGMIRGTPGYMSPEQMRSDHIDGRSDIFVMGLVLYRICVGCPPFQIVQGDFSTYKRAADEAPPPPHLVNPAVPEPLSAVILKAMHRDIRKRYQTGMQLARDLNRVAGEVRLLAGPQETREMMAALFPDAARAWAKVGGRTAGAAEAAELEFLRPAPDLRLVETDERLPPEDSQVEEAAMGLIHSLDELDEGTPWPSDLGVVDTLDGLDDGPSFPTDPESLVAAAPDETVVDPGAYAAALEAASATAEEMALRRALEEDARRHPREPTIPPDATVEDALPLFHLAARRQGPAARPPAGTARRSDPAARRPMTADTEPVPSGAKWILAVAVVGIVLLTGVMLGLLLGG